MRKYTKKLKTLHDIRRYLAAQINMLDRGEIDENRLRCISYALSILAGIIRDSDLESRIEQLEKLAEQQPGRLRNAA